MDSNRSWNWKAAALAAPIAWLVGCDLGGGTALCHEDADCLALERCDRSTNICILKSVDADGGSFEVLALTGGMVPSATVGEAYHHALVISGGTPPHTWTLEGAPSGLAWLSIDPARGELGGTPTAPTDELAFEVRVVDAVASSVTATFQIAVSARDCSEGCGAADGGSADAGEEAPCTPGTVCRPALGDCDIAEVCDPAGACPADELKPSGGVCRVPAGPCDLEERCTGASAMCPQDELAPSATVCRSSAGPCDQQESCSGTDAQCPADQLLASGAICRAAVYPCDVAEKCDGSSSICPADGYAQKGKECRAAAGACDVAEFCTGSGADCPGDARRPPATICRAAVNVCDSPERCDGVTEICPGDQVEPATKQCGPETCSAGSYTPTRYCHGLIATCNSVSTVSCNGYQCSGAVCGTSCTSDAQCLGTHFCQPGNQCAPKRVDGQPCTQAKECVSGTCTISYPDADGDGFGASNGTAGTYCGVNPPAGRSATKNDCCDADARARPGQTSFFTTARTSCGGFDFNCDAFETMQYQTVNACQNVGDCSTDDRDCGGGTGWSTQTAPACGAAATYVTACSSVQTNCKCPPCSVCSAVNEQRTQGCL